MEKLTLKEIAKAVDGLLINCIEDTLIQGVTIDSRQIEDGGLFIAINGNNFDGHQFVKSAIEKGCSAAMVSGDIEEGVPCIKVKDTLKALKLLAKYYRNKFNIPVIAVTGSTGKTSTKEMISSVLEEKYKVHKTKKNFNNEIGLPLSILDITSEHEISVLEMGMNNPGEIQRLVDIAGPNIGVITNIGTAHIENLGSRENIFKAKMEITSYFQGENTLIVNGDDDFLKNFDETKYRVLRISTKGCGNYNAENIINLGSKGVEFTSTFRGNKYKFRINIPGLHNVYNALMGIAIADIYNLSVEQVIDGIYNFKPGKLRMDIIDLKNGSKIINDCYNANVDSMKAAIDVLQSYKNKRKIAVLGDMFELGEYSVEAHKIIGGYLNDKCDIVIAVGNYAKYIWYESKGSVKGVYFETKEEACQYIKSILNDNDVILVKASRGMKFEDITDYIIRQEERKS